MAAMKIQFEAVCDAITETLNGNVPPQVFADSFSIADADTRPEE